MIFKALRKLNKCDYYTALWFIYYLQGTVYAKGSIISRSILIIALIMSVCHLYKVIHISNKPPYFKGLFLIIAMFTFYGLFAIVFQGNFYRVTGSYVNHVSQLQAIDTSLLPIFTYYYYASIGALKKKQIMIWFFLFIISATVSYHQMQKELMEAMLYRVNQRDAVTNNIGYTFLAIFPGFIFFKEKPLIQFALLGYVLVYLIMGMKRGAILIGALCSLYYIRYLLLNADAKIKKWFYLLTVLLIIAGYRFIIHMMNTSEYMLMRINDTLEGDSSHRDVLYSFFWEYYKNQDSIFHLLFGNGQASTAHIFFNFAHNDWLEILINNGMMGAVIYIYYWMCLVATTKRAINYDAKIIMIMFGLIYIFKTFFSMSYNDIDYSAACFLGYSLVYMNKPQFE